MFSENNLDAIYIKILSFWLLRLKHQLQNFWISKPPSIQNMSGPTTGLWIFHTEISHSILYIQSLEDFKFKISKGYEQNWSFLVSALFNLEVGGPQAKQGRDWKTSIWIVAFWSFKLKVFKSWDLNIWWYIPLLYRYFIVLDTLLSWHM